MIDWLPLLAGTAGLAREVAAYFDRDRWAPVVLGQAWYHTTGCCWCWAWAALLVLGGGVLVLARRRRSSGLEAGSVRR